VSSVKKFFSVKAFGIAVLAAAALVLGGPALDSGHSEAVAAGVPGHSGAHGRPAVGGHAMPRHGMPGHGFVGHPRFDRHPGFVRHGRGFVFVGPGLYWWPGYAYVGAPPAYWYYYCPSARNYYPYVVSCPEPWVAVPAG
jgi:hypothetical protein